MQAPNPFAFNPAKAQQSKADYQVDYISPQKRKNMKEYLSNSSINLANGQEVHFSSQDHFQSSNQVHLTNPTSDAPSIDQLRKARELNTQKQRY